MADVISRLKLESGEFDSKIKRAAQGIQRMAEECHNAGGTLNKLEDENRKYIQSIGRMETVSKTARGSLAELTSAFMDMKHVYNQLSQEEKNGEVGRELSKQIDTLKHRVIDAKAEIKGLEGELSGSKFGQFGTVIDSVGQKFGITGNLTEMLTSKTALLTGAIGAVGTAVAYATKEWAAYNQELAKQDQITTVTTGLKGDDAERMTSAMRALSRTYGADFRQAVNAANTLMSQFGATGDEAIQLLRDGMQGMIMGDAPKLLQMIQQFAPAFHDAGVSASQLVAVIQNSEGGLFTDQNMNAIVMGIKNIRLMTNQTSEALAKLGIDGQEMSRKMSDGSLSVFDALKQVSSQLKNVDAGSQTAGEVMQAVFGRTGAMAGTNLAKAIETLNTDLAQTKKQTGELGDSLSKLQQANESLEVAIRNCFGYDGWEVMANGIKTDLVLALSNVLEITNQIKESWVGQITGTIFDSIIEGAKRSLGPLTTVYEILTKIKLGGGGQEGIGYSDIEKRIANISKLGTKEEREKQYNLAIDEINRKINNLGKDRWRKNADGSTSNYILSAEEQAKNREALERRRQILEIRRESIINGTANTPTKPTPLATTGGSGKTETVYAEGSITAQTKLVSELTKKWNDASDEMRTGYLFQLVEAEKKLKDMKDQQQAVRDMLTNGPANGVSPIGLAEQLGPSMKEIEDELAKNPIKLHVEIDTEKVKSIQKMAQIQKTLGNVADAASSIGQAFNSIEDPAAKVAGTVAQAIATMALAYAQASAATSNEGWGWIAFAATGLATMMSSISAIHSATGYAEGGIVKGNSYSGDNIMANGGAIGLNAGELVLNKAQQSTLASQLSDDNRGMNIVGEIQGEKIVLVANRFFKRTGQGEIVTWR